MTLFFAMASALMALALWPLVRALWREPEATRAPHGAGHAVNLALLHAQRAQSDADRRTGRISAEEHAQAQAELAQRVLEETAAIEPAGVATHRVATLVTLLLIVPALGVGLYARLGEPGAIGFELQARQANAASATLADVDAMVRQMAEQLEARPADNPADATAWEMLARSQAGLQRYADADRSYQRALALAPNNPQLLADRADLLILLQSGDAQGAPMRLIARALAIDPQHPKALALAGSAAYDRQDFGAALGYWQRAREQAAAGSAFADGLERSMEAARTGLETVPVAVTAPAAPAASVMSANGNAGISGRVEVAPALRAQLREGDTLFVVARALQGPRLPLAVLRLNASAAGSDFRLSDEQAMAADHRLSGHAQVVLEARISRSGNATPQTGDLVGRSAPLAHTAQGITLQIDTVVQ
ncbi:MAG: c-type cytochrome biogenesis protein CcmI [Hydrogenophaga sp.]